MINSEVYTDIECFYCHKGGLGTKGVYNWKTQECEPGWFFCLNCGRHIFVKPEQEKSYA